MTRFVVGYPTTSLSCFLPVQVKLHSRPMTTMGQLWHNVGARTCHVVSSAQRVEIDHSPSFASIAQRADLSAEKLAFFLLEPHPKMPNMSLSRKEADDLAAYIAEQRR
jgi:hypothetical protein